MQQREVFVYAHILHPGCQTLFSSHTSGTCAHSFQSFEKVDEGLAGHPAFVFAKHHVAIENILLQYRSL
ncbi:hypothetical protein D1872_161860 [compost metagenome]